MAQPDGRSVFQRWADDPVAAWTAAALAAAAAAAIATAYFTLRAAGDEPPIRVRNGSFEMEIVHSRPTWEYRQGYWRLSRGTKGSSLYRLYLAPTAPGDCGNVMDPEATEIRFILKKQPDDGVDRYVDVDAEGNNKKTRVTATGVTLVAVEDDKILRIADDVYIAQVRLGFGSGQDHCSFAQKDSKFNVLLAE